MFLTTQPRSDLVHVVLRILGAFDRIPGRRGYFHRFYSTFHGSWVNSGHVRERRRDISGALIGNDRVRDCVHAAPSGKSDPLVTRVGVLSPLAEGLTLVLLRLHRITCVKNRTGVRATARTSGRHASGLRRGGCP